MLEITLSSGTTFRVSHVELFNEALVAEIATLTDQVARRLGASPAGIGFFGSPGWVAGSMVALGILESLAATQAAKDVAKIVPEIARKALALKNNGRLFQIDKVQCADPVNPQTWSATAEEPTLLEVDTAVWSWPEKKAFLEKYNIPTSRQYEQILRTTVEAARFVHDGGGFVRVKAEGRTIGVRWNEIVSYCVIVEPTVD